MLKYFKVAISLFFAGWCYALTLESVTFPQNEVFLVVEGNNFTLHQGGVIGRLAYFWRLRPLKLRTAL